MKPNTEQSYKDLLEYLLHELAVINSMIKTSSEIISKSARGNFDKIAIGDHSSRILEYSLLLSFHLDTVSFKLNPTFFIEIQKSDLRNLFGKFHKACLATKRRAKEKLIKVSLNGNISTLINLKPIIDTLPILILDNALKYSPKNSVVDIDFFENHDDIEVEIRNMGPYISNKEIKKIFDEGFRSEEAIKTGVQGQGFGLSLIKYICEIHNAKISVKCSEIKTNINNINYAEFTMNIIFNKRMRK